MKPDALKMGYVLSIVAALALMSLSVEATFAATPAWTDVELANSVAHEGQWLVVRQPEAGWCIVRQSYEDIGYMDLLMKKDGIPTLILPFFGGIEQTLTYWVDNGIRRRIVLTKTVSSFIKLSPDLVSEMTAGKLLTVRVKPVGDREREQQFSLNGFAAARKWLGGKTCQKKVPNRMEVEIR